MIRVKAGIFSLTAPAPPDDDGSYLRWHLLDHMPEQYQLPGIVHGLRWIADGDYLDHRFAAHGPLGQVGNAVHYLVTDPVEETFDDFVALGRALRENGRFPSCDRRCKWPACGYCSGSPQRTRSFPPRLCRFGRTAESC